MRTSEKVVVAALIVALLLAVIGLILSSQVTTFVAMGLLVAIAVGYTVLQVIEYFKVMNDEKEGKKQLTLLIITVVVALVIICLAILTFTGKLFG